MDRCGTCGLPLVECSALGIAREGVERYLRERGYGGVAARTRAGELVPHPVRENAPPPPSAESGT